jgi:hypothetical protein
MDCGLWPIVNFIGFSLVPYHIQPTYMAFVQFFWQVYISSVAVKADNEDVNGVSSTSTTTSSNSNNISNNNNNYNNNNTHSINITTIANSGNSIISTSATSNALLSILDRMKRHHLHDSFHHARVGGEPCETLGLLDTTSSGDVDTGQ